MRFFPWLSVFLLHRWKYNFQKIIQLKITVLSQKLIIFCSLVDKYYCLLLSLSGHMRRKRQHYQLDLQREKRTVWRPRNITDSARKRLNNPVISEISIHVWTLWLIRIQCRACMSIKEISRETFFTSLKVQMNKLLGKLRHRSKSGQGSVLRQRNLKLNFLQFV